MGRHETGFATYELDDRYRLTEGRVFLTGTQALVRILIDQARRDRAAGLGTEGFVSGYRGSPLGGVDLELWRARERLAEHKITFMPAINEDLAATLVLGSQQAALEPGARCEGVFGMWYGKGPGVDRSGDALRHGNAYGSHPKGGVLVVAGDDHGCVSSSMPHQSDVAFMTWFMPVLHPASVAEYLDFGEYGYALSRYSGTWVGFKAISEVVESGRSVELQPPRKFVLPQIELPPGGLHVRRLDPPSPGIEERIAWKLAAVEAFVEANPIDRRIYDITDARVGIVTTGKAHLDLMEALRLLGLDEAACRRLGIDIYKVGMVWPLARRSALAFVRGKQEVLVVEEKRGIIESQFKEYFYDWPGEKPRAMVGKHRAAGDPLLPWTGELSPLALVPVVAERLDRFFPEERLPERARALTRHEPTRIEVPGATRTPWFCSGCPHNVSTRVPEGSRAQSGIGCHVMATWMDRNTDGFAQMGGEGVTHVAASVFSGKPHVFQNLGEGTWYHSGSLAVRQAVARNANITFKILFNDAVAMTGGQPVDGPLTPDRVAWACRAEGVERIAVVSDEVGKLDQGAFPPGTSFHERGELDQVQRELREVEGVSILIYVQACATEKRRRRKRGLLEDPPRFAVINELVCEGCGDCSVASNCLSIEPVETALGRKRRVNLSSCNKDFSCLEGFCPSFVTVEGGRRRRNAPARDLAEAAGDLPAPDLPPLDRPHDLLVTGVGGTGVVTVGALVTMAAHLEGKGATVLDFTGFSQKFGTVLSHIRLARAPEALNQVRIDTGEAEAVIACDIVVASSAKASVHYRPGSRVALNLAEMPTGELVMNPDASLRTDERRDAIAAVVGEENLRAIDARHLAETLLGDAVFANVVMLGFAWQLGLVPVGEGAIRQAILLNGVAIEANNLAFDIGRLAAAAPERLPTAQDPATPASFEDIVAHRADYLAGYQDSAYAARYRKRVEAFRAALPAEHADELATLAARGLFRLMAYKDEYEVARLHTGPAFRERLEEMFEGDFTVRYHLAPPVLSRRKDWRGRPRKRAFGPWLTPVLRQLARFRWLRGTPFDPFGWQAERREERALIGWYEAGMDRIAAALAGNEAGRDRIEAARTFLAAPMQFRGFGPVKAEAISRVRPGADAALAQLAA